MAQSDVMEEFFAALVRSPSLIPRLDTLIIHFNFFPPDSFWTALLLALFSRPTQFRVFRIEIPSMLPASQMPAPKVIAALRELAVDGTQVHISAADHTWNHVFN